MVADRTRLDRDDARMLPSIRKGCWFIMSRAVNPHRQYQQGVRLFETDFRYITLEVKFMFRELSRLE